MARPDLVVEFRPGATPLYDPHGALIFPNLADTNAGASSPDDATFDITGDIDIRVNAMVSNWGDIADEHVLINRTNAWSFRVEPGGTLVFYWDNSGGVTQPVFRGQPRTVPPGADGRAVVLRVTLDVNVGGTAHDPELYMSYDGTTWVNLPNVDGTTDRAGTTSIRATTTPITVGYRSGGPYLCFPGEIYAAEVRNGIGGSAVVNPDFTIHTAGTTGFTDAVGRSWSIVADAELSDDDGVPWITLSAGGPHGNRVLDTDWETGRRRDFEDRPPAEATIILRNDDRLFDPQHASGTYFGQLLPRVPFRIRSTDDGGSTHEDQYYGFVRDGWEQTSDPPAASTCTVQLEDLLAVLSGTKLRGVAEATLADLGPVGQWQLDGPSSTEVVADLSGAGNDGEVIGNIKFGERPLTPGSGTSALYDGEFGSVSVSRSLILPQSNRFSVVATFRTAVAAEVGSAHPLFMHLDGNAPGGGHETHVHLYVHTDGLIRLLYLVAGSGFAFESDDPVIDDQSHVVFAQGNRGANDNFGIAVDTATMTANAIVGVGQAGNGVSIGGMPFTPDAGYTDNVWDGYIGTVAIYPYALSPGDRQAVLDGLDALAGYRSDEVIAWVLDQLGVPAHLRDLDQGRSVMGALDTDGADALDFIRQVTATEQGAFYVDHHNGGKLRFVERFAPWLATRSTVVQATFSDDPTDATAVRVEPGSLSVEPNGVTSVVNQTTVKWADGEVTVDNPTSRLAYGPRGRTITSQATTGNQATSLAQWVNTLYAEPTTRVRGLGIRPDAAEDAFPTAVDLRPGDLVEYREHPQAVGTATTRELTVEGVHHSVRGRKWATSYYVSAAVAAGTSLFILGTSELDGADVLGF